MAAHTARAIIILVNEALSPDEADATVLRIVLGLRGLPVVPAGHVVAALRDIDNEPLVQMAGGAGVETLVTHDLIGRLMLMSARQPGLARVYSEILGFGGDEFYLQGWPELARDGAPFRTLQVRMPDGSSNGSLTAL